LLWRTPHPASKPASQPYPYPKCSLCPGAPTAGAPLHLPHPSANPQDLPGLLLLCFSAATIGMNDSIVSDEVIDKGAF